MKVTGKIVAREFLGYTNSGKVRLLIVLLDDAGKGILVRTDPNSGLTLTACNAHDSGQRVELTLKEDKRSGRLVTKDISYV